MVYPCLEAAERLETLGIRATVINEPGIDDGGANAQGLQPCRRFQAGVDHGAQRQDADVGTFAQNLAFADLQAFNSGSKATPIRCRAGNATRRAR